MHSIWTLLALSGMVTLCLFGFQLAVTRKVTVHWSPLATGLLALGTASWVSTVLVSPNKAEAATHPLGAVTFTSLLILVMGLPMTEKKYTTLLLWFLSAGAGIVGLVAIYQALLVPTNPLFSPIGGTLPQIAFLCMMLPLTIGKAIRALREKKGGVAAIAGCLSVVTVFGIAVTLWELIKQPTRLLPISSGWLVFLETIKQPVQLLLGIGPENYLAAFTSGRPVTLNATTIWDTRFTTAPSFLLHIGTTLGIAGVAGTLFLFRSMIFLHTHLDTRVSLFLAFLVLLFLPPSLPVFIAVVAIGLLVVPQGQTVTLQGSRQHQSMCLLGGGILILAALSGIYLLARVYLGEIAFNRALSLLQRNDGTATYHALITAVNRNPYPPRFHATLSQTSLSLATAVLNQVSDSGNQSISDKDRQVVTDLYQQAIREAKIAIQRAPTSVIMWENLANIYRSFLGVATNADAWTIAALTRAMELDPTNPLIRLQIGTVYLRTNRTDEAIAAFQTAIARKENLANAHYSLAYAFKQKKDYLSAVIALQRVSQLVRPGSTDADRVNADLAETMESLSTEELTALAQAPAQAPTVSIEEILSPVVEFSPIPSPKISFPTGSPLSP